jgi:glycosyltransferase involved in cell wall biosynthesis
MINASYLLIVIPPYFEDENGEIWLEELWYRDLVAHLDYIKHLVVVCERRPMAAAEEGMKFKKLEKSLKDRLQFAPLPTTNSTKQAPINFPINVWRLWRLIRKVDIVHSGVAGWPYPIGAIANPIARLLKKPLVIVVESSPWRLGDRESASKINRFREKWNEKFAVWSVRVADLAVYTSPGYVTSLGEPRSGQMLVSPANWVQNSDILNAETSNQVWDKKSGLVKVIFPSRLVPEKGVEVVLSALEKLDSMSVPIQVDVIGWGEMTDEVIRRLERLTSVKSSFLKPVPYGDAFFSLIRKYDALIAPTLGDEQPRIIFDAYSQGLPVIASDTTGQSFIVDENQTGFLYPKEDAGDLATKLFEISGQRARLREMGIKALESAKQQTHEAMHARREVELQKLLAK